MCQHGPIAPGRGRPAGAQSDPANVVNYPRARRNRSPAWFPGTILGSSQSRLLPQWGGHRASHGSHDVRCTPTECSPGFVDAPDLPTPR